MIKRMKSVSVVLCVIVALSAFAMFGLNERTAKAYGGIASLTEQQLYNETNTYDASSDCFDENGEFITTWVQNRKTSKIQYNISYNMSAKQSRALIRSNLNGGL